MKSVAGRKLTKRPPLPLLRQGYGGQAGPPEEEREEVRFGYIIF